MPSAGREEAVIPIRRWFRHVFLPVLLVAAVQGDAQMQVIRAGPDSIGIGRSVVGEPCNAARNWRDPAIRDPFDQSWSLTCRSVAASRPLGSVRVLGRRGNAAAPLPGECAPPLAVTIRGLGAVEARRCRDRLLSAETVVFTQRRGTMWLVVSAAPAILGAAEEAARRIAAHAKPGDTDRIQTAEIVPARLPPWPPGTARALAGGERFDAAVSLAQGINLNHKGLYLEASRVLNDALSRLPADVGGGTRAELLLEAALADSNIGFSSSATEHFTAADPLLAQLDGPRGLFLSGKRQAYGALDLLNQRRFREALVALDRLATRPASTDQPLKDPAVLRLLNQGEKRSGNVNNAVTVPETTALAQLTLDAQVNWARSVTLLALGDGPGARRALDRAQAAYAPLLNERIDQTLVLWLGAQIERQRGRLLARDRAYPAALASYDLAIDELRRAALGTAGTGREPSVAEAQLERAVIVEASGAREQARTDFGEAIDSLNAANQLGGSVPPIGFDRYLDLLVAEADKAPRPDTAERFFSAMQAIGEPAVARQVRQLQAVVAADPAVGVKMRDRAELEREITRLRYTIAASGTTSDELERQRQADEAKLLAIDADLAGNRRFSTTDDRPVTIADLRAALHPAEAYLKIAQVNGRVYGLLVTAERTWTYRVAASSNDLETLAAAVRGSVDGKLDEGRLVPFNVAGAYTLFRLLTGPATDALLSARALVVDPAGPLQNLPAGILVVDRASVDRQASTAAERPFDFSGVSFLATRAVISTALSPRSFLVTRALPPSTARQPFLGLGEHQPAVGDGPARTVSVGFGCSVPFASLADLSRRLVPINRRELAYAAGALGYPAAPEMVGAAFSDSAILKRGDLADYQVLHFATHGLEEGVWGCPKSPPALVTSFGDARSDGLLSFSEIAGLRLNANLVILSACDTAGGVRDEALARRSGQEEAGSTLEGLVRAFLAANSRAVLATYWSVSADAETDRFITTLYGAARRMGIGGAVQTAQTSLIRDPRTSHPFYWGPYFLVGDAAKPMLSGALVQPTMPAPTVTARIGGVEAAR